MEWDNEKSREHLEKLFPELMKKGVFHGAPINPETGKRLLPRVVDWLRSYVVGWDYQTQLVYLAWPNVETVEERLMIRLWLNEKDRLKGVSGRSNPMKPGRALKHLFPYLTDSQVNEFVDQMRRDLGERKYTLKTGSDAGTFRAVYTGKQCQMENPLTNTMRKSLANSCMRYSDTLTHKDTKGNYRHAVEAYASGEFEIVYVEDDKGLIAARCVVWKASTVPVPAPIYGVCERSMDLIQAHLDSIGADGNRTWEGACLEAIEARGGGWIAPYLDLDPQKLTDDGESLVVDCHGEIDASDYGGILNGTPRCECESCGRMYDPEDEGACIDDMQVCDSCYEESNYCDYYDERTFADVEPVNTWCRGRLETQHWSEPAIEQYAEMCNGDLWRSEDLIESHDGEYITPEQVEDGEYFVSEWDGCYYPTSDMCETEDGDCVGKPELDSDKGIWEQGGDGIWRNVQLDLDLENAA